MTFATGSCLQAIRSHSVASASTDGHARALGLRQERSGTKLRTGGLLLGLMAKAKAPTAEELHQEKVRKIARSVDQVIGATLSGYCGPWVVGMIVGSIGGAKEGFKAAMRNGVNMGNSWGLMSAAFCGLEVLSREVRGKHDKWNNMLGACGAGAVGACGKGIPAMGMGCLNFAGMSYLLDMLMERTQDPFDKALKSQGMDKDVEGMQRPNKRK
jgi:hypothetical protein